MNKLACKQIAILKAIKANREKLEAVKKDLNWQYSQLLDTGFPADMIDTRDIEPNDVYFGDTVPPIDAVIDQIEKENE